MRLLVTLALLTACSGKEIVPIQMPGETPDAAAPEIIYVTERQDASVTDAAPSTIDAGQDATPTDSSTPAIDAGPRTVSFTHPAGGKTYVTFSAPANWPVDSQGLRADWKGYRKRSNGSCSDHTTAVTGRDDSNLSLASGQAGYCQPSSGCVLYFTGWCEGTQVTLSY